MYGIFVGGAQRGVGKKQVMSSTNIDLTIQFPGSYTHSPTKLHQKDKSQLRSVMGVYGIK